jgi:hypothetical protein
MQHSYTGSEGKEGCDDLCKNSVARVIEISKSETKLPEIGRLATFGFEHC